MRKTHHTILPALSLLLAGTLTNAHAFFDREKNFGNDTWGARVTVAAGDNFDKEEGEYTLSAKADARARAFGVEKSVVSAEGRFMANKKAHTTVDCQLKLVGLTVWQYENGFEGKVTSIGDSRFIKEVILAKTIIPVGPLPVTVTVASSLEAYTEFEAGFEISDDDVLADMNWGPVVDVAATATAELTVHLASAGIEGTLGLVHQKLAAGTSLSFETGVGRVYLERRIRGLNGRIDLVGTLRYPVPVLKWKRVKVLWKWVSVPNGVRTVWRTKRYPHTIASFAQPDTIEVLWDKTAQLWD